MPGGEMSPYRQMPQRPLRDPLMDDPRLFPQGGTWDRIFADLQRRQQLLVPPQEAMTQDGGFAVPWMGGRMAPHPGTQMGNWNPETGEFSFSPAMQYLPPARQMARPSDGGFNVPWMGGRMMPMPNTQMGNWNPEEGQFSFAPAMQYQPEPDMMAMMVNQGMGAIAGGAAGPWGMPPPPRSDNGWFGDAFAAMPEEEYYGE